MIMSSDVESHIEEKESNETSTTITVYKEDKLISITTLNVHQVTIRLLIGHKTIKVAMDKNN